MAAQLIQAPNVSVAYFRMNSLVLSISIGSAGDGSGQTGRPGFLRHHLPPFCRTKQDASGKREAIICGCPKVCHAAHAIEGQSIQNQSGPALS